MRITMKKAAALMLAGLMIIAFMPAMSFAVTGNENTNGLYEPTNVVTTAESYSSIKVTWDAVKNAEGYKISRKTKGDSYYKTVANIKDGSATSFTLTGLKKLRNYSITVTPYKVVNNKKKYGPTTYITGSTGLRKPVFFDRFSDSEHITTQWQTNDGKAGLLIYRAVSTDGKKVTDNSKYKRIGKSRTIEMEPTSTKVLQTTPACTIKFKDNNISDSETLYCYKVRSYTKFGNTTVYSKYSDVKSYFARNTTGKFTTTVMNSAGKTTGIIIKVKSDANNYDTKIYKSRTNFYNANGEKLKTILYYSTDGKKYTKYTKAVELSGGHTMYFKLSLYTAYNYTGTTEKIRLGCDYNSHRGNYVSAWKYSLMRIAPDGTNSIKSYYEE